MMKCASSFGWLNAGVLALAVLAIPSGQQSTGVRGCLFVPGVSVPAQMPDELMSAASPTPLPTLTPPPAAMVDAATTARQLEVFNGLRNAVRDHYVYPDFQRRDWEAITARYEVLIQSGLTDDDFYAAMSAIVGELGDEHSYFQSPARIAEEQAALASQYDFVGIGAQFIPIKGTDYAAVMTVFPNGPAAEAGLLPHDLLLHVDGGPIRDSNGISRTRGPEGTDVTMTIQRPGESAYDVTVTRRRVTGALPINTCLIPNTRIGYIFLPTLLDETIDDQTREALQHMTAAGALDGLILDNRLNGGGLGSVTQAILSLFVGGVQGHFVTRDGEEALELQPEDIGGSQTVPLVVLIGEDTVSYGEVISGVLRVSGRATLVGQPSAGNVEQLRAYDFDDGSRAWLASATFEPMGESAGIWEGTGIIPDVVVPMRWDLFTEANDPALAAAVDLLMSAQ